MPAEVTLHVRTIYNAYNVRQINMTSLHKYYFHLTVAYDAYRYGRLSTSGICSS